MTRVPRPADRFLTPGEAAAITGWTTGEADGRQDAVRASPVPGGRDRGTQGRHVMSGIDMDPVIRARWTAALRSGTIPQAKGRLARGDARCCLGVLCDLAVADGVIPEPIVRPGEDFWRYAGESARLPDDVVEWAGIFNQYPHNPETGVMAPQYMDDLTEPGTSLAEHNDGGATFAEIADLIDGGTP